MKFMKLVCFLLVFGVSAWTSYGIPKNAKQEKKKISKSVKKDKEPTWFTDFKKASEVAKEKKFYMFVLFTGSDWCPWCVKLEKEILSKKRFLDFAKKHFILVKCDFPRSKEQPREVKRQNEELCKKYRIEGFPTILIMDPEGNALAKSGYLRGGSSRYVKHLKKILREIKRKIKK